jgi:hypothetical protein
VDNVNNYRSILKRLLSERAAVMSRSDRLGSEAVCAFDEERDQYLLLSIGWHGDRRQRGLHLYARIRDGKIWVEDDMTEEGLALQLVEAGVPREDIVLGFQPPSMRKYTEFAVA